MKILGIMCVALRTVVNLAKPLSQLDSSVDHGLVRYSRAAVFPQQPRHLTLVGPEIYRPGRPQQQSLDADTLCISAPRRMHLHLVRADFNAADDVDPGARCHLLGRDTVQDHINTDEGLDARRCSGHGLLQSEHARSRVIRGNTAD